MQPELPNRRFCVLPRARFSPDPVIRRLTCPVCEIELPPEIGGHSPLFPFCSVRCRQVDLYRWLEGKYAIVEQLDLREVHPEAIPTEPVNLESFAPETGEDDDSGRA